LSKKRLDSWKAIAEFLGRSLRTVQRWHELNGLPVHHFGGRTGSVFAYEEEIDRWLLGLAEESGTAPGHAVETLESGRRASNELTMTADGMWETRSERNIRAIAELYRKAIDCHAGNTAAFTGLANAMVYCALNEIVDGALAYPSAIEALRRIPQIDTEYFDAKCPAAWIDLLYHRNWRRARTGFEELARKRSSSFALAGMTAMSIAEGRIAEAQSSAWEAWRLNPLVSSLGAFVCWTVYLTGDFRQVMDLAAQMRSGGEGGGFVSTVEGLALVQSSSIATNLTRLESEAQEFPQNHTLQGVLGYAYGALGQQKKAREKRAQLVDCSEKRMKGNGYALALVSMGLNNNQEAITWLEAAFAEGALWSLGFGSDPILQRFDNDPRFGRLIAKIGATTMYEPESGFEGGIPEEFLDDVLLGENPAAG
jgi:tetratricopeptide (TPR) repeat protein